MKTVFECGLGVDAHLISNLLTGEGIANQVLGEYLQGAAGELPVDRLVRVVVADEQEHAARTIISEWESAAPPVVTDPDFQDAAETRRPTGKPLWLVIVAALVLLALYLA